MQNNKKKLKKIYTVSFRMHVLFVVTCIIIVLIFEIMLYFRFKNKLTEEYLHIAKGATNMMALELDGDKIDEYLEKNFELDEYNRILQRLYDIRDSYPDVLYLYVYRLSPEGGTIIFDLDSIDGSEEAGNPGDFYEFQEDFMSHIDELCAGEDIPGITGDTEEGYFFTYCKPIFDSNGVLKCHACVDFSMDEMNLENLKFIHSILLLTGFVTLIIMFFGVVRIKKEVTEPLNKMYRVTEDFAYETHKDYENNIKLAKELNINTKNEIERVYHVFVSVMEQSLQYMDSLVKAETDIKERDEQIGQISQEAYRDSLTGVGSKMAYAKRIEELKSEIDNGYAEFAIVMIDMNDLKKINDEYGHKKGDMYIKGCCHAACEILKHSAVYRVGGDEFVAILTGQDYADRNECVESLHKVYIDSFENKDHEPWLRFSAAVGMAEYTEKDGSVEEVVTRADEAMYIDKKQFKEKYGSYR